MCSNFPAIVICWDNGFSNKLIQDGSVSAWHLSKGVFGHKLYHSHAKIVYSHSLQEHQHPANDYKNNNNNNNWSGCNNNRSNYSKTIHWPKRSSRSIYLLRIENHIRTITVWLKQICRPHMYEMCTPMRIPGQLNDRWNGYKAINILCENCWKDHKPFV